MIYYSYCMLFCFACLVMQKYLTHLICKYRDIPVINIVESSGPGGSTIYSAQLLFFNVKLDNAKIDIIMASTHKEDQ